MHEVTLRVCMGATIGPPEKPICELEIDPTLVCKDQTLGGLSSNLKLKGHLSLFAMFKGTPQKLIKRSVSSAVQSKLILTFLEDIPRQLRVFQRVTIKTVTS